MSRFWIFLTILVFSLTLKSKEVTGFSNPKSFPPTFCSLDEDCFNVTGSAKGNSTTNSICYFGRCECAFGYFFDSFLEVCVKIECSEDVDCSSRFPGSRCGNETGDGENSCVCEAEFSLDEKEGKNLETSQNRKLSCTSVNSRSNLAYFNSLRVSIFSCFLLLVIVFSLLGVTIRKLFRRQEVLGGQLLVLEDNSRARGGRCNGVYGGTRGGCCHRYHSFERNLLVNPGNPNRFRTSGWTCYQNPPGSLRPHPLRRASSADPRVGLVPSFLGPNSVYDPFGPGFRRINSLTLNHRPTLSAISEDEDPDEPDEQTILKLGLQEVQKDVKMPEIEEEKSENEDENSLENNKGSSSSASSPSSTGSSFYPLNLELPKNQGLQDVKVDV